MHWILQENIFNESAYEELLGKIRQYGLSHSIHKVVPFVGELQPEPEPGNNNVICLGSYSMRHSARKNGWYPGVFDIEAFDFPVQLQHWGTHMLNHDALVTEFGKVSPDDFSHDEMFIRPTQDSKTFSGTLMFRDDFFDWQKKVCDLGHDYGNTLSSKTLIQVVPPKTIFSEHRFWVVKGSIATSSTYKLGRSVVYQPLPLGSIFEEFAKDRIKEWQPHEAFVIDIADTDEGLKVVEINTLNSCGFYACDIGKLIQTLENEFDMGNRL